MSLTSSRGIRSRTTRLGRWSLVFCGVIVASLAMLSGRTIAAASIGPGTNSVCTKNGGIMQNALSLGGRMYCNPPTSTTPSALPSLISPTAIPPSTNVSMASYFEDRTRSGVQIYGQSEVSIAAIDTFVLGAWNDGTGFFADCGLGNRAELTGIGFSTNGGASFADLGGPPNALCAHYRYFGDPSVENWKPNGVDFAYVTSIFLNVDGTDPKAYLALAACQESISLSCGQPTIVAVSSQCIFVGFEDCSFLDKPFATIDPLHGRLYISYTEFNDANTGNGDIQVAVCDIGTRFGTTGPLGGTNAAPVCKPGGIASPGLATRPPFETIAHAGNCVNQGSYPGVDVRTGDLYVTYEFNWLSNLFNTLFFPNCNQIPTKNVITRTPFANLIPTHVSPGPTVLNSVRIVSIDAASISGYNRRTPQDFPRIAVSGIAGTVSIAWNDVRFHPLADILFQSFALGTLAKVQLGPVKLNTDTTGGLHFMPMMRNDEANGRLNVGWFQRANPTTDLTDVFAAADFSPLITTAPPNIKITTAASSWLNARSSISPNFGDYNDEYTVANPAFNQNTGFTTFYGWSDGRIGEPQPFEAHE